MPQPHPDFGTRQVRCGVITVSDTRSPSTDKSGRLIQSLLTNHGHQIADYAVIKDDPKVIAMQLKSFQPSDIDALIFSGGTGIAPRDNTFDILSRHLEKTLPGFGEIFRSLSYGEIGSRAIATRATAGTYRGMILFSLPGSSNAVRLAMETLILPELQHLVTQLRG